MQLLQVFCGMFLQRLIAEVGKGQAAVIGSRGIGRQVAAAMRSTNLEAGKSIQRSIENQVRERDGRVQRIADHVGQIPVALETLLQLGYALRMDEDGRAKLFGLRPKRIELWRRKILAVHASTKRDASQSQFLDAFFHLGGGEIGILNRDGRK